MAAADVDHKHPIWSRFFLRLAEQMDADGLALLRKELVADLRGRVIEPGIGPGLNLRHYPPTVSEVVGIEPEPHLRQAALRGRNKASFPVTVSPGVVEDLPATDGEFDAAVISLVLCSVEDPDTALREVARVVRPGGEIRFLEHVRAPTPWLSRIQRLADATVWPRLGAGCHASRDPLSTIRQVGLEVMRARTEWFRPRFIYAVTPWVLIGAARLPITLS